jgi:hypothetical protein
MSQVIGPSKRAREDGYLASPARKLFRSAPAAPASMPLPKGQPQTVPRSYAPAYRADTARRTPTPTRVSGSPIKPLPNLPQPSTSPLEVDLAEFDAIFADFPLPPSASQATSSTLSLPVAGSAGKSRLEDALHRLEGVWTDLRAEVGLEEEQRGRMYLLEKEVQRTKAKVDIYRRKVEEMEGMLAREKSERGRAAAEARGMVAHLEKRLAKEQEDRVGRATAPFCKSLRTKLRRMLEIRRSRTIPHPPLRSLFRPSFLRPATTARRGITNHLPIRVRRAGKGRRPHPLVSRSRGSSHAPSEGAGRRTDPPGGGEGAGVDAPDEGERGGVEETVGGGGICSSGVERGWGEAGAGAGKEGQVAGRGGEERKGICVSVVQWERGSVATRRQDISYRYAPCGSSRILNLYCDL